MRRRLINLSLLLTLFCVVTVAVALFCVRELHRKPDTSFVAVEYIAEPGTEQEPTRSSSSSSSRATATASTDASPDIIVATSPSAVSLDELSLFDGESGEESGGESGLSFDLGSGSGKGSGAGSGDGTGRGNGSRHGLGLNNDIQIVLALDASGSMDFLFKEVSASMERMVATLCRSRVGGRPASVNVGILAYGAARSNGAPWKLTDFTTRTDTLRRELGKVACDGSNECCGAAIAYAVNEFKWNRRPDTRALKVLIIAGNEDFYQGGIDARSAIAEMRDSGIILNVIHCGAPTSECEQWKEAARLGGGVYMELNDEDTAVRVQRDTLLADYGMLLRQMTMLPALPLGSPAEQEKRLAQWEKVKKSLPNKNSEVPEWVEKNAPWLALPAWDAAEQFRCLGEGANLAALGGRGNLPAELRKLPEAQVLARLTELAAQRQELLNKLKAREQANQDLGLQILRAVREQGRSRGIIMKL